MSADTRLWMYRKGEARLFEHPDHVPENEDWRRFPLPDETAIPAAETRPGATTPELSQEEKLGRTPRQRLMQIAADCGIRFDIGWTKAQLKQAIIGVLNDSRA